MRILNLSFWFVLIVVTSCKKDKDSVSRAENLLINKNWKLISVVSDPPIPSGNISVKDIFAIMPACSKDDFTRFHADGTATFDEGPTKCYESDPQAISSSWSFNSEKTILTVTTGSGTIRYTILELTTTRLKFSFIERDDETGTDYTLTGEYIAQQ